MLLWRLVAKHSSFHPSKPFEMAGILNVFIFVLNLFSQNNYAVMGVLNPVLKALRAIIRMGALLRQKTYLQTPRSKMYTVDKSLKTGPNLSFQMYYKEIINTRSATKGVYDAHGIKARISLCHKNSDFNKTATDNHLTKLSQLVPTVAGPCDTTSKGVIFLKPKTAFSVTAGDSPPSQVSGATYPD